MSTTILIETAQIDDEGTAARVQVAVCNTRATCGLFATRQSVECELDADALVAALNEYCWDGETHPAPGPWFCRPGADVIRILHRTSIDGQVTVEPTLQATQAPKSPSEGEICGMRQVGLDEISRTLTPHIKSGWFEISTAYRDGTAIHYYERMRLHADGVIELQRFAGGLGPRWDSIITYSPTTPWRAGEHTSWPAMIEAMRAAPVASSGLSI